MQNGDCRSYAEFFRFLRSMKQSLTWSLIAICFGAISTFSACAGEDPQEEEITDSIIDTVVVDSVVVDSADTIPYVKVILPSDTTLGTFSGLEITDQGDFLLLMTPQGTRRFYLGVLPNGNPLVNQEYNYRDRRVTVFWKKGERTIVAENTTVEEDSVVSLRWHDYVTTIGSDGTLDSLEVIKPLLREGDTLRILPGVYEFNASIEFWGLRNVVIEGQGEVELVCTSMNNNVLWLFNSEGIQLRNMKLRHTDPPEGLYCTGNVIGLDGCQDITIANCEINGCGAIGVYSYISNGLFLRGNHIHHNSFYAVEFDGVGLLSATDSISGLSFEDNLIEMNGLRLEAVPDTVSGN